MNILSAGKKHGTFLLFSSLPSFTQQWATFSVPLQITFRLGLDKRIISCFSYYGKKSCKIEWNPHLGNKGWASHRPLELIFHLRSSSRTQILHISFSPFPSFHDWYGWRLSGILECSKVLFTMTSYYSRETEKALVFFEHQILSMLGTLYPLQLCDGGIVILISECGHWSSEEIHWPVFSGEGYCI